MNSGEKVKHGALWSVLFAVVSLAWIFPIVLVIINSFKQKAYISRNAFSLPTGKAFVGLENYTRGLDTTNFFASFGWTLLITVGSVALILVCTSMCAWWIVRVNNWAAKLLYTLFLFNMIVPFQMVMFTLSKLADMLKLNTPWGLCFVYLGFGAGLAVFIFTGVVKGIPESLEESAMIDGASVPRIFFQIVVPIMKPSIVSVAILQAMWIWNDYLLPYLTLDLGKYKTISVAVQYLKGGYGSVDMGAMMACSWPSSRSSSSTSSARSTSSRVLWLEPLRADLRSALREQRSALFPGSSPSGYAARVTLSPRVARSLIAGPKAAR